MAILYKHLRIHQIFGANTNVGKTIFATSLVRASAARLDRTSQGGITAKDASRVYYLKPVSTGPLDEADDSHVTRFSEPYQSRIKVACLYQLGDPVSPHLAVRLAKERMNAAPDVDGAAIPDQDEYSQEEFIKRTMSHISRIANETGPFSSLFVEAAGGVLSPSLAGIPQIDAYRPLFLPTLLVGDSRLGGISSTISAYESLVLRGYIVDAILLFRDDYHRNWEYLEEYFGGLKGREKVDVLSVPPPPPRLKDLEMDAKSLERYYTELVPEDEISGARSPLSDFLDSLDSKHSARLEKLESMPQHALDSIWWPFVQHKNLKAEQVTVVDSAYGDFLNASKVRPVPTQTLVNNSSGPKEITQPRVNSLIQQQYDASASWWTQSVGHAHHSLTLAAARAAGRYGHVIFPLAIHEPALQLTERLIGKGGPGAGWADKVFFSDNGSTGAEVALKMAIRAAALRYKNDMRLNTEKQEMHILGISGSYHGDTIGAMDACEGGVFNSSVEWYRGRGYWFKPPRLGIKDGKLIIILPSDFQSDILSTESMKTSGGNEIRIVRGPSGSWYIRFEGPVASALEWVYDVQNRLDSPIAKIYLDTIRHQLAVLKSERRMFGALVVEPLVMGAGGMVFVDPLFQRILISVVRSEYPSPAISNSENGRDISSKEWRGLPVIFDEVFVGLYRLGFARASDILGVNPDISVLAKILTGGLLPLSVTLARQSIYDAFLGDRKEEAMLHGHSYTAHPVGCEVGNTSLELMNIITNSEEWKEAKAKWAPPVWTGASGSQNRAGGTAEPRVWSLWDPEFVSSLSRRSLIQEVMTLGTLLAFRLSNETTTAGYQASSADSFMRQVKGTLEKDANPQFGIHFRTLGDVAYLMSSLNTPSRVLRTLEQAILSTLP